MRPDDDRPANGPIRPRLPARKRLDYEQVEVLVVLLLLLRAARSEAVQHLKPEHFSRADEAHLAVLWRAVLGLHAEYPKREAIPYPAVRDACRELAYDPESGLSDDQRALLLDEEKDCDPADKGQFPGLLYCAYRYTKPEQVNVDFAMEHLRRFLVERAGSDAIARKVKLADAMGLVVDVDELVEHGRRAGRFRAIGDDPFETFAAVDLGRLAPLPVTRTGIGFLDTFMGGGPAASEIVGVMGPTGGGKSTLISQLAGARARACYAAEQVGGPRKVVYYFAYEDDFMGAALADGGQPIGRVAARMLADVAGVDREILESASGRGSFSTVGRLKPYERALFAHLDPATAPGEWERLAAAKAVLAKNLQFANMLMPGRGGGGVAELVALIERDLERRGGAPCCVLVDSIDRMVGCHLAARGMTLTDGARRLAIMSFIAELRHEVAARFGCDVWVTNQLDAASNKRSGAGKGHYSEATDAKGWANALDFCLVFYPYDANHVTHLTFSKARRGGRDGQSAIIQLEGAYARWRDASGEFVVSNGEFVPRSTLAEIRGMAAALPRPAAATRVLEYDPGGIGGPFDARD